MPLNKILFIFLIILYSNANDKYLLAFIDADNDNTVMKYNIKTKEREIYAESYATKESPRLGIEKAFYTNGRVYVNLLQSGHANVGEIINYKLDKSNEYKYIEILGTFKKRKLILASLYSSGIYLLDLNFKKVKFIGYHPYQWNNIILSDDEFIYAEKIQGKIRDNKYVKLWLYNIPSGKKTRLEKLENICGDIKFYRSQTKQLVCSQEDIDSKNIFLTDIYGLNQEEIDITSSISPRSLTFLYYSSKNDSFFYRDASFSLLRFKEIYSLQSYSFKTRKSVLIEDNIIVRSMDIID